MRKLSSSKLFIAFGALAFVIAGAACSDSDTKPDTVTPKEAGAETAPPKEAGAETAPPTEAGVETAPPTEAGAETAPTEAGTEGGGGDAAPSASFSFNLEGSQQVPPVTTTATGTAVVTINAAETEIKVDITFSNLSGITAAHIHEGASGATGGPIFTLASAAFTSPFTKTLTASDFAASGSVTTFAQAIAAIKAGNTYINIHTSTNASGEIRGQVKNP